MTRKERERESHRREIVRAARRVFAARGFAETTMDEVAVAAEFGKGTLYSYFPAKEELFATVLDETVEELAAVVASAMESASRLEERIEALARGMFSYAIESPESLYLVARELRVPVLGTRVGDAVGRLLAPLVDAIDDARRDGRVTRDVDPVILAQMLMSMIVGRFLSMVRAEPDASSDGSERATPAEPIAWCNAMMRARGDRERLRSELDAAVAAVHRLFLHGALEQTDPSTGRHGRSRSNGR